MTKAAIAVNNVEVFIFLSPDIWLVKLYYTVKEIMKRVTSLSEVTQTNKSGDVRLN